MKRADHAVRYFASWFYIPAQNGEARVILPSVACLFGYNPSGRCSPIDCLQLGFKWFPAFATHRCGIRAAGVWSRRRDLTGQVEPVQASPPLAQLWNTRHGFLFLGISLGAACPSSFADWPSCSFHCLGADHFPFHWVPSHDHRDMSGAHQRNHFPTTHATAKKKDTKTREQTSGLLTILHTCTRREPILQRTKLGKHRCSANELIKFFRATLVSDATSLDSRSCLAFGSSGTPLSLFLHLFSCLCDKAVNLPVASASFPFLSLALPTEAHRHVPTRSSARRVFSTEY